MLPDWSPLPVFLTRGRWKEAGRVPKLDAGASYHTKVTYSALVSRDEVQNAVDKIKSLEQGETEVTKTPLKSD